MQDTMITGRCHTYFHTSIPQICLLQFRRAAGPSIMPTTRAQSRPNDTASEMAPSSQSKATSFQTGSSSNPSTIKKSRGRSKKETNSKQSSPAKDSTPASNNRRSRGKERRLNNDVGIHPPKRKRKQKSKEGTSQPRDTCTGRCDRPGELETGKDGGWWLCKKHNIYISPDHPLF